MILTWLQLITLEGTNLTTPAVQSRLDELRRLLDDDRPKSKIERLCYARQIGDLENIGHNGLEWDEKEARRNVEFFKLLHHWKGKQFVGKPFIPEPWQEQLIIAPIFGWKREDEFTKRLVRRINEAYGEIPRKNGKSFLASGIASQGLLADGETGPEVYSAASLKEQAKIVFNDCRKTLTASPELNKLIRSLQHHIECPANDGILRPVASDYGSLQGLGPSRATLDELHVHRTSETYDAIVGGAGGREDMLIFMITTAGMNRSTICWNKREHARRLLEGAENDPTSWAFIACAEDDDDIEDPQTWWKANPNLGVSVFHDYLKTRATKAASTPSYENEFRRVHLNQWTSQQTRWISVDHWDKCQGDLPEMFDTQPVAALDCGNTRDPNAMAIMWREDGNYYVRNFYWMPENAISQRAEDDRVELMNWAKQGHIRLTPGNTTDYTGALPDQIAELLTRYGVRELGYDPWNTVALQQELYNRMPDVKYTPFRQAIGNFAAPTKEFERIVLNGRLHHTGCPVTRWMFGNVAIKQDVSGNIRPDKEKSSQKIDGIVATIMALGLWLVEPEEESVYEEHGVRFL